MKLNKNQLKAIKHNKGPLLIIAGAGTGKTTVITERIKHLIAAGLAKPDEILALTFTEKASREMEERVDEIMPLGYTQMWISTFHKFADHVLRDESLAIGLDPHYKLLSQVDSVNLMKKSMFNLKLDYFLPLGNPNKFVFALLQHFSRLQDEDVNPDEYIKFVKKLKAKTQEERLDAKKYSELANAYFFYDQLKTKNSYLDFGDLITKTLLLFRKRKNVLKNYQDQFKYILVDEFQDTNFAQTKLTKLLVSKNGNITVVADDDQSIYRFRGAAVSNVLDFKKAFPKAKTVALTKNYRSLQDILDKSYELINFNNPDRLEIKQNIDKHLSASRKGQAEVGLLHLNTAEEEAEAVAKKISELAEKYSRSDIAILVRANNHADPFIKALERAGIPHQFLGPAKLFKQAEVLDLVAVLKVLVNIEDSVSLARVFMMDVWDLDQVVIAKATSASKKTNTPLFEVAEATKTLKPIVELLKNILKISKKESGGQALYKFLVDSELLQKLLTPENEEAELKAQNISKLFSKIKTFETDNPEAGLEGLVDWISLSTEAGESPQAANVDWSEVDAVNILTIHSSKGLEFPIIFLVNLVSQRFPSINRREPIPIPEKLIKEELPEGDFHTQEERRLFYVGATRAKDKLFLTAANYYGEAKREKKLSPFIFELLGEDSQSAETPKEFAFNDFSKTAPQPTTHNLQPAHVDYLSYSQMETFLLCPMHYKLRYVLNIPSPPSAALSFGSSVHNALKDFFILKTQTQKTLLDTLNNNWINEGYTSKTHEQKALTAAKKQLRNFHKNDFNKKTKTVSVEQPFVLNLKSLKIGGRIDRVDDLGKGTIEVTDYKTGSRVPSQKEVDNNLQLTIYALATDKQSKNIKLTLHYLDSGEKISTTRTKEDLKEATAEILEIKKQIEESDFRCSGHPLCRSCEFSQFCNVDK